MRLVLYTYVAMFTAPIYAQIPGMNFDKMELASFNYGLVPDLGTTQIENYTVGLGFGIPMKKGVIGSSIRYDYYHFRFNERVNPFDISDFEKMHSIGLSAFYLHPLSSTCNLMISAGPALMSNFQNGITSDDLILSGRAVAIKRWGGQEKNAALMFGAAYGILFGAPNVFPIISFRKKVNDRWSYSLGLPQTGATYRINERNQVSILISPDSYFGNNSSEVSLDNFETLSTTKLQYLSVRTGLEHRYQLQPNITIVTKAGLVPFGDLEVRDVNNNVLYEFETDSSPYISTGLSFNINRNSNDKKNKNETNED
ncbi:MAG: DUF6268 family outer membrane beta-barrel protein [Bacteroidota bacterium]